MDTPNSDNPIMNPPSEPAIEKTRLPSDPPSALWLWLLLAGIFAWRIVFSAWFNLLPDECSYWTWSRRLDWSYFDNSGMVAYLIRLSTWFFGESTPFSVRFPFLVVSFLGSYVLYSLSTLLFKNRRLALLSVVTLNLTPVALLGGSTAMHDNILIFYWVLAALCGARFLGSRDGRWFYAMGAASGLAILSKYTGVLAIPALLLFLVWNRDLRGWLLRKEPWLGALIAAVFTLPIVWWNMTHDWASLHHILFIGSGSVSVLQRILDGVGYHLSQFLLGSPLIYFVTVLGIFSALAKNIFKPSEEETLLICFSFPLALFGVMAFKGHVEANWGAMGYPTAIVLAIHVAAKRMSEKPASRWIIFGPRYRKWVVGTALIPAAVFVLHAWVGLLPASLERKMGKTDRIIWETRGWDGLGRYVGEVMKPDDVLAGDKYQLCALLEFNVPSQPFVRYLAPWRRPTQFDVWETSFDNLKGRTILFVSSRPLEPTSKHLMTIYENFERVEQIAPYKVMYHGAPIRDVYLCRGYGFDPFSPKRLGPRSLFYVYE